MYNGRDTDPSNSQATLMRLGKRASAMSVNQELHTLADMYRGGHVGDSKATLMRLGKRAPGMKYYQMCSQQLNHNIHFYIG